MSCGLCIKSNVYGGQLCGEDFNSTVVFYFIASHRVQSSRRRAVPGPESEGVTFADHARQTNVTLLWLLCPRSPHWMPLSLWILTPDACRDRRAGAPSGLSDSNGALRRPTPTAPGNASAHSSCRKRPVPSCFAIIDRSKPCIDFLSPFPPFLWYFFCPFAFRP